MYSTYRPHTISLVFTNCHYVTDVRDVTGLIHGTVAGADASCIYLESFFFSLFTVP